MVVVEISDEVHKMRKKQMNLKMTKNVKEMKKLEILDKDHWLLLVEIERVEYQVALQSKVKME